MTTPAPLRIGPHPVSPPIVLAPMAGITNSPFRRLCREFGGGLYVSEMITTRALVERDPETMRLIEFAPDEPVDWLFCDMAWRPLEVAQMLGRWARRRYARHLVANFKLPMKRKAEMVVQLREILAAGGYVDIRTRQLYHDRQEITLSAHVR